MHANRVDGLADRAAHTPAGTTAPGPANATADTTVNGAKGRTPVQKASNPLGYGPPADLCRESDGDGHLGEATGLCDDCAVGAAARD